MKRRGVILLSCAAVLALSGAVTAAALQDTPQEARPAGGAPGDPIADLLNRMPPAGAQTPTPAPESAPNTTPAPSSPVPEPPPAETAAAPPDVQIEPEAEADIEISDVITPEEPAKPVGPRQRRRIAVIQAIDKVTAETMRFEVEVGGRPVRFNRNLIFTARACEVSSADELVDDAVAYLEISVQPRVTTTGVQPDARQVFRGWMFASAPGVSGLQHPHYDAWIVGCKA